MEFDKQGLIPVVVQDFVTGEVRMVAFATREALALTLETGRATFWSRSRGELWEKGRTSGNALQVHEVLTDCDSDALIYLVTPCGPTCHTGAPSCFFRRVNNTRGRDGSECEVNEGASAHHVLSRLEAVLEARRVSSDAKTSYAKSLYEAGPTKIAAKLIEEAGELGRAVAGETDARVVSEAADVVFHVLVALRSRGVVVDDVLRELQARMGTGGHDEKRARPATG